MDALYPIFVVYVYVAVMAGLLANHAVRHGHPHVSPLEYAFKLAIPLSRDEKTIYVLIVIFAIFTPFALHTTITNNKSDFVTLVAATLLFGATIIAAISFFTSPTVKTVYKKYTVLLNLVMFMAAAVNFSRATSYAEGIIVELTGVRASELPTAVSWLSIIMVPMAWVTMLAMAFLIVYALAFLGAGIKSSDKTPLKSPLYQVHIIRRTAREHTALYTIAFCCGLLALSPITLTGLLLKTNWIEKTIREQLVSASFHSRATTCGVEQLDGAKVALLEAGKAIVAIPDRELGYKFELIECSRKWGTAAEIMKTYGHSTSANLEN